MGRDVDAPQNANKQTEDEEVEGMKDEELRVLKVDDAAAG